MMEFFSDTVVGEEVIEELIVPVSNLLWPTTGTSPISQDGKFKTSYASTYVSILKYSVLYPLPE